MMLKSKRLKPNMVDRHIAYIQQEQQKNQARLALYPDLVKALAHLEADWRLLWPVTVSESLKEAQAVLAQAEAVEKEVKG